MADARHAAFHARCATCCDAARYADALLPLFSILRKDAFFIDERDYADDVFDY